MRQGFFSGFNGATPTPPDPTNADEEYLDRTGVQLTEFFAGDSPTGQILGIDLTQVGTADDSVVTDRLLFSPSFLQSTAYDFPATGDAWVSDGSLDFGDGSFWLEIVCKGTLPTFGFAILAGNIDATDGIAIRTNIAGDVLADVRLSGEATVTFSLMDEVTVNPFTSIGVLVKRLAGMVGTVQVATLRKSDEKALAAGTLTSTVPFTIGNMADISGSAWRDHVMYAAIAIDPAGTTLKDLDARTLLQASAKGSYWAPTYSGVIDSTDDVDISSAVVIRPADQANMVHGELVRDIVADINLREDIDTGRVVSLAQIVLDPFTLIALSTPVIWEGYRTNSSTADGFVDTSTADVFLFLKPLYHLRPQYTAAATRSTGGNATFVATQVLRLDTFIIGVFVTADQSTASTVIHEYRPREITDFGGLGAPGDLLNFIAEVEITSGTIPVTLTPLTSVPEHGVNIASLTPVRGDRP